MKRIKPLFILILSIALVFALATNASAAQTPGTIEKYGEHFYQVVTTDFQELTWSAANAAASAMTPYTPPGCTLTYIPHLATITTQAEQDFLYSKLSDSGWLWIGLYQAPGSAEPAGGWTWVTGETFDYENWNPDEPNNGFSVLSDLESYGEWNGASWGGGWNDINNTGRSVGFIVEYEASCDPVCEQYPAAPSVAANILKDLGIRPKYDGGNYISDVAEMMGSSINDENSSWFMGNDKRDVLEYYNAVYDYLDYLGAI